jgi:hypothetical protein
VLAAGAATGFVLADLEQTTGTAAVAPATAQAPPVTLPPASLEQSPAAPLPATESLRPAPAPQNPPGTGLAPDATTRAS